MPVTPLPLVPRVFQVSTLGTLAGKPCDHVVNYIYGSPEGYEQVITNGLPAIDIASWTAHMLPQLPVDYVLTGSRCVYLGDLTTTPHEVLTDAPGTNVGPFGPYFSACTWRWPAPGRGRGKDGRTNFPGPQLPFLAADHYGIDAAGVTAYTTAMSGYFSQIASASEAPAWGFAQPVIVNRKKGTYTFPQPGFIDPYVNVHRRWVKRLARH